MKEVRAVRAKTGICPSAMTGVNVPEMLKTIIEDEVYKEDYNMLTLLFPVHVNNNRIDLHRFLPQHFLYFYPIRDSIFLILSQDFSFVITALFIRYMKIVKTSLKPILRCQACIHKIPPLALPVRQSAIVEHL